MTVRTQKQRDYMRSYRATDKGREANLRNTKRSRIRRKIKLLNGRACANCGFTDVRALQFHHPDGVRKEGHLGSYRRWEQHDLDEAMACTVLCANCHFIHHNTWEDGWLEESSQSTPVK